MALPATLQWDIRTTGSDSNGGAFDPGVTSPGTDFSQQNSAQIAYTDLVIGTTNTQLSSSLNAFTSAHVGNTINITSGTGFTVGRYNVRSVTSGVATMDRAVGTASSTGGHGNLGGSMATPVTTMAAIVSGNSVWVQAGTYTVTATVTNTSGASFTLAGYGTTHGDNVAGAIITTATNSLTLVEITPGTTNPWIHNIALSNTTGSHGGIGISIVDVSDSLVVTNSSFSGFTLGVDAFTHTSTNLTFINTSFLNHTGTTVINDFQCPLTIINCLFLNNTGTAINVAGGANLYVDGSVIAGNSEGISAAPGMTTIINSTIAYNTGNGINLFSSTWFGAGGNAFNASGNIIYGNGGFGITAVAASTPNNANLLMMLNAFGANSSGDVSNVPTGSGAITLTADPFTNHSSGDYSLNSAAGGGALLRGLGYPGTFTGSVTTGHRDVGAVQSGVASPSSGTSYCFIG
jgi:hypothetical protein